MARSVGFPSPRGLVRLNAVHVTLPTKLLALALIVATATATEDAHAASFRLQSQTVGDAYQLVNSFDELINRRRLHQYLGFSGHDLLSDGEHQLNIVTMLRFDADFGLGDDDLDDIPSWRREQLSLQYAYLDARDIGGFLDARLGRQVKADTLDYLMLDGLTLRVELPFYVAVEVIAGLEVDNDAASINASMQELDGVRFVDEPGASNPATIVVGGALTTANLAYTRGWIGYRRLFSDGKVDSEKFGAALYQRVIPGVHVNGAVSYDLFNGRFDRIDAGARWQATDFLDVHAQYLRQQPSFDADSIFNIFSSFPLNDVTGRVRLHLSKNSRVYAGGMVRFFGNEGYTDGAVIGTVDTLVRSFGAMAGWSARFGAKGRARIDVSYEGGYGGDRTLFDLGGTYNIVPNEWQLDGRLSAVIFRDELQPELNAASFGYQVGGRYRVVDQVGISLMVEHNINRLQTHQLRVFALVDVDVWL